MYDKHPCGVLGYFWQEERKERKCKCHVLQTNMRLFLIRLAYTSLRQIGCMMWNYDGLPGSGKCWYGKERRSCRNDQLYIARCSNEKKQKFRFLEVSGKEVLIQIGNDKNLCLQRYNREIFLKTCDSGNEHQRWFAPAGSFDGPRFELSQRRASSLCVTQVRFAASKIYINQILALCL